MNPQHTIPTLVDGDFVMTESRAAALYLVSKYSGEKKAKLKWGELFNFFSYFSAIFDSFKALAESL